MDVATLPARLRGITLIELLTTLGVALALTAVGIPMWAKIMHGNGVTAARDQMRATLNYARLAATKHREHTTICPTSNGQSCNRDHTTWHLGYLMFLDSNGNKQREPGETLLRVSDIAGLGVTIHSSVGRKAIRYSGDGSAWGSNVTLRFCSGSDQNDNKAIVLYGSGRSRYSDTLADGSPIQC